jgi:hypothetical protein
MSGAIPSLPQYASWRGAQLKHRDNFTFNIMQRVCRGYYLLIFNLKVVYIKLTNSMEKIPS